MSADVPTQIDSLRCIQFGRRLDSIADRKMHSCFPETFFKKHSLPSNETTQKIRSVIYWINIFKSRGIDSPVAVKFSHYIETETPREWSRWKYINFINRSEINQPIYHLAVWTYPIPNGRSCGRHPDEQLRSSRIDSWVSSVICYKPTAHEVALAIIQIENILKANRQTRKKTWGKTHSKSSQTPNIS